MTAPAWTWFSGDSPVLAMAIHSGSQLRPEVAALTALDAEARRREEDPFTDRWTEVSENRCVFSRSRFEVDANRARARAVYRQPEDCWGLQPWLRDLPAGVVEDSLALYDRFYAELFDVCAALQRRWGRFVVLDLHSYNHRRLGPDGPAADIKGNPEINVGTVTVDRRRWGGLVATFITDLAAAGFDTRENVRFGGATLAAWIHGNFPDAGCCLAVDVKKIYIDEHTGVVDPDTCDGVKDALAATLPGLRRSLGS